MEASKRLILLARLNRIQLFYYDIWGNRHLTSSESLRLTLQSMGIACRSEVEIDDSVEAIRAELWREILPPVKVVEKGCHSLPLVLTLPKENETSPMTWEMSFEDPGEDGSGKDGEKIQGGFVPASLSRLRERVLSKVSYVRYLLEVPCPKALGYYRLTVACLDQESGTKQNVIATTSVIVAPQHCFLPDSLQHDKKTWGISWQLYSVRGDDVRNGAGDYADLERIISITNDLGGSVVGLNPLHALSAANPWHCSPYSPISRTSFNSFYINVDEVCRKQGVSLSPLVEDERQGEVTEKKGELVDYAGVWLDKLDALATLFENFKADHLEIRSELADEFLNYVKAAGEDGLGFAVFQALSLQFAADSPERWSWLNWPVEYRSSKSEAVKQFAETSRDQVLFQQYLMWHTERQLKECGDLCLKLGFAVGLYFDLALGAEKSSFDIWKAQGLYALSAASGAPGDELNLKGQNWGLPPLIPRRFRKAGYQPFIDALRVNMRYAGAIRLDHVMSLFRLFWVPESADATKGVYVRYYLNDLIGIVALESQRNRTVVVGEDLGTVPPEVSQAMKERGLLWYKVLMFMKDSRGNYISPEEYPALSLVTPTTHDLPTIRGFWEGHDNLLRNELDLFPNADMAHKMYQQRIEERWALLNALKNRNLISTSQGQSPDSVVVDDSFIEGIIRFLAATPSKLLVIPIEDLLLQLEQVNVPGVVDEYPCWKRRLSMSLEKMTKSKSFMFLRAVMSQNGR